MLFAVMFVAIGTAKLFPDTILGGWLHRWLAERPAAWLAEAKPRHLLFAAVAIGAVMALAPVMPVELALIAAGDVSAYLDVLLAVWLALAAVRSRVAWKAAIRVAAGARAKASRAIRAVRRPLGRTRRWRSAIRGRPTSSLDEDRARAVVAYA